MCIVMSTRALVAYATKSGSTAEIAQAIAAQLRLDELDVDVLPAERVTGLHSYGVVIVGSPLYAGHWRRPARRLLRREREALRHRQVWLFSSGLSGTGPAPAQDPTPKAVATLAAEIGAAAPVTFAGALLPATARGLVPRLMARKSGGDHRDWAAIRTWAHEVATSVRAAEDAAAGA
jgi:menaquinone-dependent protoporphyrinogen oxidase